MPIASKLQLQTSFNALSSIWFGQPACFKGNKTLWERIFGRGCTKRM